MIFQFFIRVGSPQVTFHNPVADESSSLPCKNIRIVKALKKPVMLIRKCYKSNPDHRSAFWALSESGSRLHNNHDRRTNLEKINLKSRKSFDIDVNVKSLAIFLVLLKEFLSPPSLFAKVAFNATN